MQVTDTIADMLTRIRNANSAKHDTVRRRPGHIPPIQRPCRWLQETWAAYRTAQSGTKAPESPPEAPFRRRRRNRRAVQGRDRSGERMEQVPAVPHGVP